MEQVVPTAEDPKRPYTTPRLRVYGDLRRLTQGSQNGPTPDGGGSAA